jgi:hypothetical protein
MNTSYKSHSSSSESLHEPIGLSSSFGESAVRLRISFFAPSLVLEIEEASHSLTARRANENMEEIAGRFIWPNIRNRFSHVS